MDHNHLTPQEQERYHRHLILPHFGEAGQLALKKARVLVIGAGGLGAPVLNYLAAAGVGHITIADHDVVDHSNLQRQVLFSEADVGRSKAQAAAERLRAQNAHIKVEALTEAITNANARALAAANDLVIDGTDNFPTRYLANDACVLEQVPYVYGSVVRYEGQVAVFNLPQPDGHFSPNYRDLFPAPPPPGQVPNCAEGGVLGVLPGIVGSVMANEAIKVLAGVGEPLTGRLWVFDGLRFTSQVMRFTARPDNPLTGSDPTQTDLIDYESFCGLNQVPEITPAELHQLLQAGTPHRLIDVRTAAEREAQHIGGDWLELGSEALASTSINFQKPTIVYCRSGKRSAIAVEQLLKQFPEANVKSLAGGLLAWSF